jgi:hypothetical protein
MSRADLTDCRHCRVRPARPSVRWLTVLTDCPPATDTSGQFRTDCKVTRTITGFVHKICMHVIALRTVDILYPLHGCLSLNGEKLLPFATMKVCCSSRVQTETGWRENQTEQRQRVSGKNTGSRPN